MAPSRALRPPLAELLLTNLRLLDLDLLEDWPQITPKTFATKDGQVLNQKERITCTEWALYRLFEIWDPDQARYKLQPFFPPLEPIQSRNLRAALYRMLEDAKKHGTLGRDTVLRRTMLDDCKSEKLVEVLVVFSTAVIRRFLAPELLDDRYHSLAVKLATSPILNSVQQAKLAPMAIAHRASLDTLLRRKEATRERCQTFAQLLEHKTNQLNSRMTSCKQDEAVVSAPDPGLRARVEREVFGNWPGSNNAAWPHTLLYGDETPAGDQPLKRPFQDVWDVVARGGALHPDPDAVGLVESLEQRVADQKERLRNWQSFHEGLVHRLHDHEEAQRPAEDEQGLKAVFSFDSHQELRIGSMSQSQLETTSSTTEGNAELDEIVATLKKSLYEISTSKATTSAPNPAPQGLPSGYKPLLLSNGGTSHFRKPAPVLEYTPADMSPSWTDGQAGKGLINTRQVPLSNMFSPAKQPFPIRSTSDPQTQELNGRPMGEGTSYGNDNEKHINFDDLGLGILPESSLADVDGAFNYNKSTSRMSLADRTRLSMFQANNAMSQPSIPPQPTTLHSKEADSATSVIMSTGQSVADRRASLLERTQQSMSNLALAMSSTTANPLPTQRSSRPRPSSMFQLSVKKQRQSLASRDSLFPVNQFETPGKPRMAIDEETTQRWRERNATPTEKLFSGDADYASVFKSRPRVKQSPNPSAPGTPVFEDDMGIEEEDEDWMGSSPLRGKG